MKGKRNTSLIIILIVLIFAVVGLTKNYLIDSITDSVTIVTAIVGVIAIWYQLKKDHDVSKAEFVINLNNTFHDNEKIVYIYEKFKSNRDKNSIEVTEEDGRTMGDYIMFFQMVNYLVKENIVNISMIDELFANKFFIFVNNHWVQKYQLVYSMINMPVLELYETWYNYRLSTKKPIIYKDKQLHIELGEQFNVKKNGRIQLKKDHLKGYDM